MKREYPLFTLYCERNVTSAQMVQKHLKAPLFHERSGKPCVQGFQISLSDCRGITFLAVLKGKGSIGVDAESLSRKPPRGFSDIYEWTDIEAYCKATGENLFALAKNPPDLSKIPDIEITRITTHGCAVSVAASRCRPITP